MKKTDPKELFEFPCHYQFKAMGMAGDNFKESVIAAVEKHACIALDGVCTRPSGKGTFQAVSILVTLHNYEQLTSIYSELREIDELKMLL